MVTVVSLEPCCCVQEADGDCRESGQAPRECEEDPAPEQVGDQCCPVEPPPLSLHPLHHSGQYYIKYRLIYGLDLMNTSY